MESPILRFVNWLTLRHSVAVLIAIALLTGALYLSIPNLRMGTSLTDLFGKGTPELRAANEYVEHSGYGNQLFAVIETTGSTEDSAERMEALADRLTAAMNESGQFKYARCGLREQELLGMVRLFAWNFPAYLPPERIEKLRARLTSAQIDARVKRGAAGFVTAFSWLGTNYFVTDPLGLLELAAPGGQSLSGFFNFDLEWGSGNYFFSKDHTALLVVGEPRLPVTDYKFSQEMVSWTRKASGALLAEPEFKDAPLRVTLAGGYIYAEQDRKFIEWNIRLVSLISIVGNLILCLLVYRRLPILFMSLIPTTLGLLWTTGLISYYPGEINLISLSFIAILVGLGDDQVIYFFGRVPQEWHEGRSLDEAMATTTATTGKSIVFCILTTGTAIATLMLSNFRALAEFGFVLTIGMLMVLFHTLLTIPSFMHVWWKRFPPRLSGGVAFRFLPAVARRMADVLGAHPKVVLAASATAMILGLASFPFIRLTRKVEVNLGEENPAVVGQMRLAQKFGIEGSPELILFQGAEDDVLRRAEGVTAELEKLKAAGQLKSVFSPSEIVPSLETQLVREKEVAKLDVARAAADLECSLRSAGFNVAAFAPAIARLRGLNGAAPRPLTLAEAGAYLPRGLLDNSIQKMGPKRYLAAIAVYPTVPDSPDAIPAAALREMQQKFGPFIDFSFTKIQRDLQNEVAGDGRRAMLLTAAAITLIVFLVFRSVRFTGLVLLPIAFAVVTTFGLLVLVGHQFSFMALTAIPLIIGIGIDNGIHLVRRYLEGDKRDIVGVLKLAGPPLIQSNLTTVVGFGALMASRFQPLAEMGLVTALGVALALVGAFWFLPAVLVVFRRAASS
jgi:predicted RND superfamily exporter protein